MNLVWGCLLMISNCSSITVFQEGYLDEGLARLGNCLSSSQRSLVLSCTSKNEIGSPVWIKMGIFSSPHLAQIGSSLGSLVRILLPLVSFTSKPKSLNIFNPMAPAFTSFSKALTVSADQFGLSISLKFRLVKTITRPLAFSFPALTD